MESYKGLEKPRIEALLERIETLRAGVIGDACLDIYWEADLTRSILSRETPHYTLPVVEERYSPGAAGNVAANLKALGCKEVSICSVLGEDWRGQLLKSQFEAGKIRTSFLIADTGWVTPAYCKPIRIGLQQARQEDPRLDFQNFNPLSDATALKLIERLDAMAAECDIIAVVDQLSNGIIGALIRERLAYWSDRGKWIVTDSRERIGLFRNVIVKPNEIEAEVWLKGSVGSSARTVPEWAEVAEQLSRHIKGTCCLTLGSEGGIWISADTCTFVPTRPVEPPIDIVGAGDGFAAALLSALGAGSSGPEAMAFAHLAASVVIRKIGTTGTASPEELLAAHHAYERE